MSLCRYYQSSIGKKTVMAATGLCLALFILLHLAGNSAAFFGRAAYLAYAQHLHSLGAVLHLAEFLLLVAFLLHVVTGLLLFVANRRARPQPYQVPYRGDTDLTARLMPYTGLATLVFVGFHLAHFHFRSGSAPVADLVAGLLARPGWALFYVAGGAAVGLHLWHGAWSLWQTLGVSHAKYDRSLVTGGRLFAGLAGAVFVLLPLCCLAIPAFLR